MVAEPRDTGPFTQAKGGGRARALFRIGKPLEMGKLPPNRQEFWGDSKMRIARTTGLAAAAAALAVPATAQDTGWTTVGRASVGADAASGSITVRWDPSFRQGMFCTDGNSIKLQDATLRFQDGTTKVVKVRQKLADGGCSRPIAVPRKSDVETVDIAYDPATLAGGKVKVQLVAR